MNSFEQRLQRLEEISEKIRTGETDLEQAAELFEEGVKLAKSLDKELSAIDQKIEKLVNEPVAEGEKPVLELFPDLESRE